MPPQDSFPDATGPIVRHDPVPNGNQARRPVTPESSGWPNPVFAHGTIRAVFPSISVEKEFSQALGSDEAVFQVTDETALQRLNARTDLGGLIHSVLDRPEHLYLAREMTWILQDADGTDRYSLVPASEIQLGILVASLAPGPRGRPQTVVVTGREFGDSGGTVTFGMRLPMLSVVQVGSTSLPAENELSPDLLEGLLSVVANAGNTPGLRALNYAVLMNPWFYRRTAELGRQSPSPLEIAKIRVADGKPDPVASRVSVLFEYQAGTGARGLWESLVDVSSLFPYLAVPFRRSLR